MRFLSMLLVPAILLAAIGGRAEYIGGTASAFSGKTEGHIVTSDERVMRFVAHKQTFEIPYDRITLLEYGQKVDRRYFSAVLISPLFLLAKARKHFLTVGYADSNGAQQALIFRLEKSDVRALLLGLEARSGRRVTYQDEDARKAGKG